jgi:hypothetical protein
VVAIIKMTPNIIILPLPVDLKEAERPGGHDPRHSLYKWIMEPGTAIAYLHLHFSDPVHNYMIGQGRMYRTVQNFAVHL